MLTGLIGCDSAPPAHPPAALAQERPAVPTPAASPSAMSPTANPTGERIPVLFLVGETLGWIEPCGCTEGMMGGLARRVAYYKQLRARGYEPRVYDLGDFVDAPSPQSDLKRDVLLAAFKTLELRGVGWGELDLGGGSDFNRNLVSILTACHWSPPSRFLSPSLMPGNEMLEKRQSAELSGELSGLVLYHGPRDEARKLFADRHDAAVVFSGHGDEIPSPPERLPGGAWLVEAGMKGKFVQIVEMRQGPKGATGNAAIDARPWPPTPLDDRIPDDPEIAAAIKNYYQRLFDANLVQTLPRQPTTGGHFIGPASCKDCHAAQYKVFQSMKHAHALDSLRAKNATRDPECLRCHTTGSGFESGFSGEEATPQLACVSCESCHGVGSNHLETLSPEYGRMGPAAAQALCVRCHDHENSPRFDFKTYWEKIKH